MESPASSFAKTVITLTSDLSTVKRRVRFGEKYADCRKAVCSSPDVCGEQCRAMKRADPLKALVALPDESAHHNTLTADRS